MDRLIANLVASIEPQVRNDPSWLSQWLLAFPPSDSQKIRECVTLLHRSGLNLTESILKVFSITLSKMGDSPERLIYNISKTDFFPLLEFYLPPRPLIENYSLDGEFNSSLLLDKALSESKVHLPPHLVKILISALHHAETLFLSFSEREKEEWISKLETKIEANGSKTLDRFMNQLISLILSTLESEDEIDYLKLVNALTNNKDCSIEYLFSTSVKEKAKVEGEDLKSVLERELHPLIVNPSAVSAFNNYLLAFKNFPFKDERVKKWMIGKNEEELYQEFFHLLLKSIEQLKVEDEISATDVSKAMMGDHKLFKIYEELFQ